MVKEYNLNLIKRSATGFLISLPIIFIALAQNYWIFFTAITCLLYTSDAADEEDSVDLGGRRIIKKKKKKENKKT